jgi:CHRD domain
VSRIRKILVLAGASTVLLAGGVSPASAATVTLTAAGTGAEEVPVAGADKVSSSFTVDTDAGTVKYMVTFTAGEPATAAHIHTGAAGVAGAVVVPLDVAAINGKTTGTATVDKALLAAIVANPSAYYLNVHTATHPSGAARGQLKAGSSSAPTAVNAGTGGQFAALNDGPSIALVVLLAGLGLLAVGGGGVLIARRRRG